MFGWLRKLFAAGPLDIRKGWMPKTDPKSYPPPKPGASTERTLSCPHCGANYTATGDENCTGCGRSRDEK